MTVIRNDSSTCRSNRVSVIASLYIAPHATLRQMRNGVSPPAILCLLLCVMMNGCLRDTEEPMLHTTVNGLSITYRRAGNGPALILLHGFTQDSRVWRPQVESLSQTFTVIAWDAPGTGQSSDPPEGFGISDWVNCLAGFLDSTGIKQAHILGLSWGGLLAQEFYHRHPKRVLSLILADTYAGWRGSLPSAMSEERVRGTNSICVPDHRYFTLESTFPYFQS